MRRRNRRKPIWTTRRRRTARRRRTSHCWCSTCYELFSLFSTVRYDMTGSQEA